MYSPIGRKILMVGVKILMVGVWSLLFSSCSNISWQYKFDTSLPWATLSAIQPCIMVYHNSKVAWQIRHNQLISIISIWMKFFIITVYILTLVTQVTKGNNNPNDQRTAEITVNLYPKPDISWTMGPIHKNVFPES